MCFYVPVADDNKPRPGDARSSADESTVPAAPVGGPTGSRRRAAWWAPLGVGAAGAVALGYVVVHDPTQGSVVPRCPILAATGWWCPGCGMTRATHALAHGDFDRAMRLNIFAIPILAMLGLLYAGWMTYSLGLTDRSLGARLGARPGALYAAAAILVTFGVVRNLPGLGFLIGQ